MGKATITFVHENDDGDEISHELPACWAICSTCNGNAKHSLALGAITQEDRERDWDPDDWDDYMSGGYDRPCEDCMALGRVLEVDEATLKATNPELYAQWISDCEEESHYQAICRAERAMGA